MKEIKQRTRMAFLNMEFHLSRPPMNVSCMASGTGTAFESKEAKCCASVSSGAEARRSWVSLVAPITPGRTGDEAERVLTCRCCIKRSLMGADPVTENVSFFIAEKDRLLANSGDSETDSILSASFLLGKLGSIVTNLYMYSNCYFSIWRSSRL